MELDKLEPKLLWKHFRAICAIPHCSKHEEQVAAYIMEETRRMGLEARQDGTGNIVVSKPGSAGKEQAAGVILQGHIDMVCEKNEGTDHDFSRDPLRLVLNGDILKADGTTLGADNGIGVAAALAVLESSNVVHGPLECLFTVDEETGLTGAFNLGADLLQGRQLLNLDTEEEGAIYIGCAGGLDSVATRRIKRQATGSGKRSYRLKVAGLKGGHSGLEIHLGRGNAIRILARLLWHLGPEYDLEIAAMSGGSKRNAIPREAFATIYMDQAQLGTFKSVLAEWQSAIRSELGSADPDLVLLLDDPGTAPSDVIAPADARQLLAFLYCCPHGVIAMSPDIPDLVQTSTNLAILGTDGGSVRVQMSHRSSVESSKQDVGDMVAAYCTSFGFDLEQGSGYPAWQPNVSSPLLAQARMVHKDLFKVDPEVKAVHAGLECGIIGEKFPGMDMISIGPTITGAHSPDEQVSVKSVENFWRYLLGLLERL